MSDCHIRDNILPKTTKPDIIVFTHYFRKVTIMLYHVLGSILTAGYLVTSYDTDTVWVPRRNTKVMVLLVRGAAEYWKTIDK